MSLKSKRNSPEKTPDRDLEEMIVPGEALTWPWHGKVCPSAVSIPMVLGVTDHVHVCIHYVCTCETYAHTGILYMHGYTCVLCVHVMYTHVKCYICAMYVCMSVYLCVSMCMCILNIFTHVVQAHV